MSGHSIINTALLAIVAVLLGVNYLADSTRDDTIGLIETAVATINETDRLQNEADESIVGILERMLKVNAGEQP